jgi:hypothetical protein
MSPHPDSITLLNVIECEEFIVFLAQVVHSKMHRSAVGRCGEHHVEHYLRDPYLLLLRELLFLGLLVVTASLSSLGALSLFLVVESCHSVLSSELLPGLL